MIGISYYLSLKRIVKFSHFSKYHILKTNNTSGALLCNYKALKLECVWFWIIDSNIFCVENWILLQPMQGGVRDVALFIICFGQAQLKRLSDFSCLILFSLLLRDLPFPRFLQFIIQMHPLFYKIFTKENNNYVLLLSSPYFACGLMHNVS